MPWGLINVWMHLPFVFIPRYMGVQPILAAVWLSQRYLIAGLAAGSVKG